MARFVQSPDLVFWRKESRGVYVFCDGLARVEKVNGGSWRPDVRKSLDDDWEPAGRFPSGGAHHYGTLSVAQAAALKAKGGV